MSNPENVSENRKETWLSQGRLILNRYELTRLLGSGGWGQVYLAQDRTLGRQIAIKRLLPKLAADPEAVSRFHREASVIASIQDPFVLTVYDTLEDAGEHYMVMEYADAGTLSQGLILEGTFDPFEALSVSIDICKGLRAVHNKGIVHRDIKPANILFFSRSDGFPTAKLGDFGIALQHKDQRLTASDRVMGTLIYLSPEQASRKEQVTPSSDLYSLGVILYEMLSGELDDPFFLRRINIHANRQGIEHFAQFPESLQPTLYRALQDKPEDRFQSADEMLQALERARGRLTASLATQHLLEETIAQIRRTTPIDVGNLPEDLRTTADLPANFMNASVPAPVPASKSPSRILNWINTIFIALILIVVAAVGNFVINNLPGETGISILPTQFSQIPAALRVPTVTITPSPTATSTTAPTPTPEPTSAGVSSKQRTAAIDSAPLDTATPTATNTPTPTPIPTNTPVPAVIETTSTLTQPISLALAFRDTGISGDKVIELSENSVSPIVEYQEERFVWGEAIVTIGSETYRLDRTASEENTTILPDQFSLELEPSPALLVALKDIGGQTRGIDSRQGDFWLGQLRCGSATPPDVAPYHTLTIRLYEADKLQAEQSAVIKIVANNTCVGKAEPTSSPTPPPSRP